MSVREMPTLAVVYLNRAKTEAEMLGRERFIRAYHRFYPTVAHQLYVVNKGFSAEQLQFEYDRFRNLAPRFIDISDEGLDLEAYRKAAQEIGEAVVFFMNTYSEPLNEGWLDTVHRTFSSNNQIGLVGCTANFETHHPLLPGFSDYPNFHVRTNGFMVAKQIFLNAVQDRSLNTKLKAFQFEAGELSLTRVIEASGLQVLVVGTDGVVPPHKLWRAGIFRSGNQSNLLLADNQTRSYQNASLLHKTAAWAMAYTPLCKLYPPQRLRIYLGRLLTRFKSMVKS